MTGIEKIEIRGVTVKNIIATLASTVTIVAFVMGTYFQITSMIADVKATQETTNRVNDLRIKVLEGQVSLMQQEIHEIKDNKKP